MGGGYKDPPWVFKGRALYQLSLVKAEEARKFVPPDLKLVQAFGYTLGGFYLARYSDSPAGKFDELVALAGLVWNPPTSCAWAGRVYVSSKEARDHGVEACGLHSRLARFDPLWATEPEGAGRQGGKAQRKKKLGWWQQDDSSAAPGAASRVAVHSVDPRSKGAPGGAPACTLALPLARPPSQWAGPPIKMALPSFSGRTPHCLDLLKYALDLRVNVRLAGSTAVSSWGGGEPNTDEARALRAVFTGRPLIAMAFDDMEMLVGAPEKVERLGGGGEKKAEGKRGGAAGGVVHA